MDALSYVSVSSKPVSRERTPDLSIRGQAPGSQRNLKLKFVIYGFFFETSTSSVESFFACGQ
jgi:hypothetical protein